MAWQGKWQGKWNGNWHGPVETDPGAMYANLTGSGGITSAEIVGIPEESNVIAPSGGFPYPLDALRSPRHVPKTASKIIKRIAKKQVDELVEQEQAAGFVQELETAFAKADLQYKAFYAEVLQIERERLIDEEIKRLFRLKHMQDEDEEVLAILMASMY